MRSWCALPVQHQHDAYSCFRADMPAFTEERMHTSASTANRHPLDGARISMINPTGHYSHHRNSFFRALRTRFVNDRITRKWCPIILIIALHEQRGHWSKSLYSNGLPSRKFKVAAHNSPRRIDGRMTLRWPFGSPDRFPRVSSSRGNCKL
eukprot:5384416-Pyramimonas_sp.AAC.1